LTLTLTLKNAGQANTLKNAVQAGQANTRARNEGKRAQKEWEIQGQRARKIITQAPIQGLPSQGSLNHPNSDKPKPKRI
jgi:hypothetical protein